MTAANHYILIAHVEVQEARLDEFIKLAEHVAHEALKTEPPAITFETS